MRKLGAFIAYTLLLLIIGRNLSFLPLLGSPPKAQTENTALKEKIQKLVKEQKGNYGISFKDLKTGNYFGINQEMMMTAASVNKVPIIAVLYSLENKGKINFNDQVTLQKEDLQDYGTGSLRYQKPGGTYSIKTLAKLTLQQSDNTAAHILANKIGEEVIQSTINSWGLKQTDIINNQTSSSDMQRLFEKIYRYEITTEGKTREFLSFMTETENEDRLPADLPSSASVIHKTGDGVGFIHDVGIIRVKGHTFFLGVLTSDIGSEEAQTRQTIAEIAKIIADSY